MRKPLGLLICEDYKREAAAVIKGSGFEDVKLYTFPAVCRMSREKAKDLSGPIFTDMNECERIVLIGSGCVRNFKPLPEGGIQCRSQIFGRCFYMLANKKIIDGLLREKAVLQTPGFINQWRQYVKEMKLDKASACKFFGKSAGKVTLLDTGASRNILGKLHEFAKFLNLPCETVPVGLDYFSMLLNRTVLEWRLETAKNIKGRRPVLPEITHRMSGRREHERINIDRKCLVEMDDSDMVELMDISLGGIRLRTPRHLAAGCTHSLKIFPSVREELDLSGEVVWTSPEKEYTGHKVYETGIKFLRMNKKSLNSLRRSFMIG